VNEDFRDLLAALLDKGVRFMIAGAHALAVHGTPRATGDLDIWVERDQENADRVWRALGTFGAPVEVLGISRGDFVEPGRVIQIGIRPRRIDFLTDLTGVDFRTAWKEHVVVEMDGLDMPFVGRATLVENKRATGRLRDRADLESLGEAVEEEGSGPDVP